MDRRSFIKLTAVTGTSATLASCGNPEHQVIRFLPDDEMTPGVAVWKPSVCPLCASGCGLTVRVMEADVETVRGDQAGTLRMGVAKKLEGNPAHPVNQGRLCARGQSAIQVTYHPDRITRPLKRTGSRGAGAFAEISWDDAIGELVEKLDALASSNKQAALAYLRPRRSSQRDVLIDRFLAGFGAPAPIAFQVLDEAVLRRANLASFGREQMPTFDLSRARFVLSFGADFLGTWNSPVAQAMAYGEMRQGRPGVRGAFVQIEPRMTQTGANADQWIPAKPGTEGVLALGIAHVILANKLESANSARVTTIAGWSAGLPEYTPARVQEITGVPAAKIERLAREFATHGPSAAIVGGAPLAQTNGLFTALAVNALNMLAGTVGEPGGLFFTPLAATRSTSNAGSIARLASGVLSGERPVDVLLLDGSNPIYDTPVGWKVGDAIAKVPFIASFGSFLDETSAHADLILPDHSFLESWVDAAPESGSLVPVVGFAGPVMRPLHQTRATADVLIEVAKKLKKPVALPHEKFEDMIKASATALASDVGDRTPDVLATATKQGGFWGTMAAVDSRHANDNPASNRQAAYAEPRFDGDTTAFPFHFLPFASSTFLDGSLSHLPWLQEMPNPLTSAMWSSWVEINPKTAERLGIADRDIVEITSSQGSLRTAAIVTPGIAPDVVAMPMGQGHQVFTRFATGRGENPITILAPVVEPETETLAWAATRVRIARVGDPDGRLILFAGEKVEKPNHGRR